MRVLLVDANLLRPSLHEVFHHPNSKGLTNSLLEVHMFQEQRMDLLTSWLSQWKTQIANLWVLPVGPPPTSSTMVLRAPALKALLGWLLRPTLNGKTTGGVIDFVIFDTSALNEGPEALELASTTDGTILIVEAGKEQAEAVRKMEQNLQKLHTMLLGVVVNRQTPKHRSYLYTNAYSGKSEGLVERPIASPVTLSTSSSDDNTIRSSLQGLKTLPVRRDATPSPLSVSSYRASEVGAYNGQTQGPPLKVEG